MEKSAKKKVLFVFDRVAHYHRELFTSLEREFESEGIELYLLSGIEPSNTKGRVGLSDTVISRGSKFRFREVKIGTFILRAQFGVLAKIREIRPDVVISTCHSGNVTDWLLVVAKKLYGFRLLAWQCLYEFNPGKIKDVALTLLIPRFDFHLAYHSNAQQRAIRYGAPERQTIVIHNTINEACISRLPKAQGKKLVDDAFPEMKDRRIVLYVGAILEEKNLNVLIEAMEGLEDKSARLLIVGDGNYLSSLKAMYAHCKNVTFAGSIVDGVGPYFDSAECFVLPGTGGLAINEAMAHGLPIISGYADGSADDLVIHGENGYRLTDGSVDELRNYISMILDNKELQAAMAEKSLAMINGDLSFRSFLDRVKRGIVENI